jgi:hypothetical protein
VVLLSAQSLHQRVLGEIGDFLLTQIGGELQLGTMSDPGYSFEIKENAPLRLDLKWQRWCIRRPSWGDNCAVTIESERGNQELIYYGIQALDPQSDEGKKRPQCVCMARPRLENLDVANFKRDPWGWWRLAETKDWDLQFVARILLEAPDADVRKHREIQELAATLAQLVQAVDRALGD